MQRQDKAFKIRVIKGEKRKKSHLKQYTLNGSYTEKQLALYVQNIFLF